MVEKRFQAPASTVRATLIRGGGLVASIAYAAMLFWLIVGQPRTVAEVQGGLASGVGLYRIDRQSFEEGLQFFRDDKFAEARIAFARADPARRDATTQYYMAYSYYREGWGRLYNDDRLFQEALDALDRAESVAESGRVVVDDPTLGVRASDELRAEIQRGLTHELSDLNPMRVFRLRK